MIARIECCRCHLDMGTKDMGDVGLPWGCPELVTSGLCDTCFDILMAEYESWKLPRRAHGREM